MSDPNTKDRPAKPPVSDPGSARIAVAVPAQPPPLGPAFRAAVPPAQPLPSAPVTSSATAAAPVRASVSRPPAPGLLSVPDEPGPVQATHEPRQWFAADSEPGAVEVLGEEDEETGERFVDNALAPRQDGRESAAPEPAVPTTLVEEGTEFKGSFSSTCPIEVKGRVDGDLAAPSLRVASSGAVHGKVKVGELRSQGEIAGEFDADVAHLSGVVKDNTVLRAKSLELSLAPSGKRMQVIFGETGLETPARGSKAPRAS